MDIQMLEVTISNANSIREAKIMDMMMPDDTIRELSEVHANYKAVYAQQKEETNRIGYAAYLAEKNNPAPKITVPALPEQDMIWLPDNFRGTTQYKKEII